MNTEYKMTVQHSWFNTLHQVLEKDLAEAEHLPSSTQQIPLQIFKQVLAGQKAVCGNRLVEKKHSCNMGGQTAHSSLPALLTCGRSPGRCQAQELAVLLVQISARTISKNNTEWQGEGRGRNREEYRSLVEFWIFQNIKCVKRASLSTTSSQRKAQPVSLLKLPSCLPKR